MIEIQKRIREIAKAKDMLILAHSYQPPEIQDTADIVADSLELARRSRDSKAKKIILCGVKFMAESASILNPDKKVILPAHDAGCPMADMIDADQLREEKRKHPNAVVVAYVNSSAEVKAESDLCCTSANAAKLVASLEEDEILFVPDQYLGSWVAEQVPSKKIHLYPGFCPIHQRFTEEDILRIKGENPDAVVLCHPEAPPRIRRFADKILSTSQMIRHAQSSSETRFIILTETGIAHPLAKACPEKQFIFPDSRIKCANMGKTTLENLLEACETEELEIKVPENIRVRAEKALERMIALG